MFSNYVSYPTTTRDFTIFAPDQTQLLNVDAEVDASKNMSRKGCFFHCIINNAVVASLTLKLNLLHLKFVVETLN